MLQQVSQFMDDHIVYHEGRCKQKSGGKIDPAGRRATAPTPVGIAQGYGFDRFAEMELVELVGPAGNFRQEIRGDNAAQQGTDLL